MNSCPLRLGAVQIIVSKKPGSLLVENIEGVIGYRQLVTTMASTTRLLNRDRKGGRATTPRANEIVARRGLIN